MRPRDRVARYRRSLLNTWKEYKQHKLGIFALGVLIFYGILAIFAPFIAPYDPDPLNRVGPNFAAPSWVAIFDPNAFPTMQIVVNPGFSEHLQEGWSFTSSDPDVSGGVVEEGWKDPGSFRILMVDDDNSSSGKVVALLSTDVEWSLNRVPADVFVTFGLKGSWSGDYDFRDVDVRVAMAPEGYSKKDFLKMIIKERLPVPPTRIKEYGMEVYKVATVPNHWLKFKADLTYIDIYALFKEPGEKRLIFAIEIDRKGDGKGIVELFIDNVELTCFSHYFGILGTSDSGADAFSQLVWGSRVSWIIGVVSTAIAVAIGVVVGLVSGYYGGIVDEVLMRFVDFLLIIPGLPLMMILATILGRTIWAIVWVIALVGWSGTARLIRSQVLSERARTYVEAARAAGASDSYIMFRHILPNVLPLVFVQITLGVAGAILSEAALSFLGLGPAEEATWGKMLWWAFEHGALTRGAWWYVLFPGLAITTLSMGFIFMGYVLDAILNPRLRRR